MRQELDNAISAMTGIDDQPGATIRKAAHRMSQIAIDSYEGNLLKSALGMVGAVAQFAEDIGRLYNEPTTGNNDED